MGGIAWTKEEDLLLMNCIKQYGEGKWHRVPQLSGLKRCRKSCRLRWLNYLRPNIKRGKFSDDEVDLIFKLHKLLGNRWSLIAGRLPGRTANDVKNYWNHHLSKKHSSSQMEAKPSIHDHQVEIIRPQPRTFKTSSLLQKLVGFDHEGPLICEPQQEILQRNSLAVPFLFQETVQDHHQLMMPQNIHNHIHLHDQDHHEEEVQDDEDDDADACFEECGNIYRQLFHDLQFEDDLQVVDDEGSSRKWA